MSYLGALSVPGPIGVQGMAMRSGGPTRSSQDGYDESYSLLMELVSQEPTIQSCVKIIQSTCLAQGLQLRIGGAAPSKKFQEHIDNHYVRFCEQAIRAMFTYGFVPWRLRRLSTGDPVPEVIPMGLFTWSTESISERRGGDERSGHGRDGGNSGGGHRPGGASRDRGGGRGKRPPHGDARAPDRPPRGGEDPGVDPGERPQKRGPGSALYARQQEALRRQGAPRSDEDTKALVYRIQFNEGCGIEEDEVEIFEYIQPNRDVTMHSVMYRTVASPLAHVLNDYRNIRRAMIQQEYADTWNTQAKMICSYTSNKNQWSVSEGNPIVGNEWITPQNRLGLTTDTNLPVEIEQNAYTRDAVAETIVSSKMERHRPVVYTLPKNSSLEAVQKLELTQDIKTMQVKLAKDITSIMGIPYELVGGGYSDKEGKKKSMENTRIFTTNMMNLCKHLECLMNDAYVATYGGLSSDVKFTLRPTPRIEIGSVEEIVMLLDAGVVSTDNAMQISNMLLGVDLQQGAGARANAGRFAQAYMTPGNKRDAATAEAALISAKARATAPPAGKK